jgi:hypothetical protein
MNAAVLNSMRPLLALAISEIQHWQKSPAGESIPAQRLENFAKSFKR